MSWECFFGSQVCPHKIRIWSWRLQVFCLVLELNVESDIKMCRGLWNLESKIVSISIVYTFVNQGEEILCVEQCLARFLWKNITTKVLSIFSLNQYEGAPFFLQLVLNANSVLMGDFWHLHMTLPNTVRTQNKSSAFVTLSVYCLSPAAATLYRNSD